MRYPDEYIEKMGKFYCSDLAKSVCPYIQEITFEEWIAREWRKKESIYKTTVHDQSISLREVIA